MMYNHKAELTGILSRNDI